MLRPLIFRIFFFTTWQLETQGCNYTKNHLRGDNGENRKPLSLDSFANVSLCRMNCGDGRVMEKHPLFYHKPTNLGAVLFMEASSG